MLCGQAAGLDVVEGQGTSTWDGSTNTDDRLLEAVQSGQLRCVRANCNGQNRVDALAWQELVEDALALLIVTARAAGAEVIRVRS